MIIFLGPVAPKAFLLDTFLGTIMMLVTVVIPCLACGFYVAAMFADDRIIPFNNDSLMRYCYFVAIINTFLFGGQ